MKLPLDEVEEIRFVVVKGTSPGATVGFEPGVRSIRIGRAVDNDVVINDHSVSRAHCRVDIRQDGNFICDLGVVGAGDSIENYGKTHQLATPRLSS